MSGPGNCIRAAAIHISSVIAGLSAGTRCESTSSYGARQFGRAIGETTAPRKDSRAPQGNWTSGYAA